MGKYTDLLGRPFKVHGRGDTGYDCYGLAMEVLRRNGVTLPDIPYETLEYRELIRSKIFTEVKYERVERPVNLCIIEIEEKGIPAHVGVYIGGGNMIHAVERLGVVIEPLRKYEKRIRGYYKVENRNL